MSGEAKHALVFKCDFLDGWVLLLIFIAKQKKGLIETRIGSGKGSPEYWVSVVMPGRIIYE